MTLPKALLVGDNTDGSNWGGRGQSLALAALLRERFEISGRVLGGVVTGGGPYVHTMLPSLIAHTLFYRRDRARWVDRLVRIQEALGARDYITGDPQKSADTIVRYARKFGLLGELLRQIDEADLVVINGEGSGIFSTPYRRDLFFYLGMAELGLRRHKPVFFVNTIFSDCPTTGRNSQSLAAAEAVLSRCADVHVRDPFSVEYAASTMPSVRCRHVPDALFTWFDRVQAPGFAPPAVGDFAIPFPEEEWRWFGRLDFSKPYVCVGGSSLARHEPDRAIPRFRRLVERLADLGLAVYVVESCGGDRFLRTVVEQTGVGFVPGTCPILLATAILTHARLLASGRFHPTILASLGGTPCVFLEAHSHKMRSLQMSLGYDDEPVFSTFPDDDEVARIVERARQVLGDAEGEGGIRARVRAAARARATEAARTPELLQQALVVR
jgi:polysaccharide pyruvyl transferase WcaK-like protein